MTLDYLRSDKERTLQFSPDATSFNTAIIQCIEYIRSIAEREDGEKYGIDPFEVVIWEHHDKEQTYFARYRVYKNKNKMIKYKLIQSNLQTPITKATKYFETKFKQKIGKSVNIRLYSDIDADIIQFLDSIEDKSKYIKDLIRQDMFSKELKNENSKNLVDSSSSSDSL